MSGSDYCKVLIKSILELDQVPFDIYIKLSGSKILRYSNKDDVMDQLRSYQRRGIDYVWAKVDDYQKFTKYMSNSLAHKFFKYNGNTVKMTLMDAINSDFKIVEKKLKGIGFCQSDIDFSKELAKEALLKISKTPAIYDLVLELEGHSRDIYLDSLMTGVASNSILDQFSWQTPSIKEKLVFASLVSKIGMSKEDLICLKKWELAPTINLPQAVRERSQNVVKQIREKVDRSFSSEIITVLSQSYELPDGSGFPLGLTSQNVILLSCIQVVAKNFVLAMEEANFDSKSKAKVFKKLRTRFNRGGYRKAVESLEASL